MKRKEAYRDGVKMWTQGEVFESPGGHIIEVLYTNEKGGDKVYFADLQGTPACGHGDTVEEAIEAANDKRGEREPITKEELEKYRAEDYKFTLQVFRRLTRACRSGCIQWLKERGLDPAVKMTIKEFRDAGGGVWADKLEEAIGK